MGKTFKDRRDKSRRAPAFGRYGNHTRLYENEEPPVHRVDEEQHPIPDEQREWEQMGRA